MFSIITFLYYVNLKLFLLLMINSIFEKKYVVFG